LCTADESEYAGQWLPPNFRGNVSKLHGKVIDRKMDKWYFSNEDSTDPDKACYVRCTVSDEDHRSNNERLVYGHNLFLFMELVSTVRVDQSDYQTLSNQMKLSRAEREKEIEKHLEAKRRREEEEKKLMMGKKGHIDGDIKFSQEKIKRPPKRGEMMNRKKNQSPVGRKEEEEEEEGAKKGAKDEDKKPPVTDEKSPKDDGGGVEQEEDDDGWADEDYITVEMSAGWVMIPIAQTIASLGNKKSTKVVLDMSGGTPFSVVGIQRSDVPPRKGILEALKRIVGLKIPSKLEFLITIPPFQNSDLLQPIPPNVILPMTGISLIGVYRHYHVQSYRQQQIQAQYDHILPQTGTLPTGDPIFSSFPKILNDPAACRVLLLLWCKEIPQSTSLLQMKLSITSSADLLSSTAGLTLQYQIPENILEIFRKIILKLWRAMSCPNTSCPRTVLVESVKSIYRRELTLRSLVGLPTHSEVLASTAHLRESKTTTSKTGGDKKPGEGSLAAVLSTMSVDDLSREHVAHTPFNVRELLWGQEDGL
jgi:hypothetical protein